MKLTVKHFCFYLRHKDNAIFCSLSFSGLVLVNFIAGNNIDDEHHRNYSKRIHRLFVMQSIS